MFPDDLTKQAEQLLETCKEKGIRIATAESCTGGLIGGLLTEIAGSSAVFERGYVTYSNHAKIEVLGVSKDTIREHGAVSAEAARAMAEGALKNSHAHITVAVTGMAGPDGTPTKPVGLVHLATSQKGGQTTHHEARFGDLGRSGVRDATIRKAMQMLEQATDTFQK